jgi:1-phosphatidylinositol-3-phosphate 5-kinase
LYSSIVGSRDGIPELYHNKLLSKQPLVKETFVVDNTPIVMDDPFVNDSDTAEKIYQGILAGKSQNNHNQKPQNDHSQIYANQLSGSESLSPNHAQNHIEKIVITNEEPVPQKEEFPPSPSDHQSILVSLSSRCVWKGTVCERSHLFRIKYYGSVDKPLGRFLRDHLFDQVNCLLWEKMCIC